MTIQIEPTESDPLQGVVETPNQRTKIFTSLEEYSAYTQATDWIRVFKPKRVEIIVGEIGGVEAVQINYVVR